MKSTHEQNRRKFLRLDGGSGSGLSDADGIHIAGIVVHTRPENLQGVRAGLRRLSGAEIHAVDPCGKLVVTLEAANDGIIADLLNVIPELPGVIACTLAHHHSEEGEGKTA